MTRALQYPTARHSNIIAMTLAFAVAAILPALSAYFIGDRSTRSKKSTLHHYNGVLFGFAAYWVAMLMSWIGSSTVFRLSNQAFPANLITANVTPVILTIIVMIILSIAFAKKQNKNTSVLQFLPYQLTLIISIVGVFIAPYTSGSPYVTPAGIGILIIPIVATLVAYFVLRKQNISGLARLSDALIAMSIGWITIWVTDPLLAFLRLSYPAASIPAVVVGLAVFGGSLYLRTRKS